MLTSINIKNFKCFDAAEIPLGKLTLLAGINGSGKSTCIQALLLLKQTLVSGEETELNLNGNVVEIGRFADAVSFYADTNELSIGVSDDEFGQLGFSQEIDSVDEGMWSSKSYEEGYEYIQLNFHERIQTISYISAERWGPRISLPVIENEEPHRTVGKNGEYVAQLLTEYGQSAISNSSMPLHPNSSSKLLDGQAQAWLSEISPGVRISAIKVDAIRAAYTSYRFEVDEGETRDLRPTNVGFGISYVLPIIVELLNAKPNQVVILENPEAHLHPAGQTAMGRMVAMAAHAGIQVIVETHSDHVLDGARIAVKEGLIDADDIVCNFFSRSDKGHSEFVSPKITKDGRITEWPEGFFDQSLLNLAKLNSRGSRE